MGKTIFQKICDKEVPANIVYEDEQVVAFYDIKPQAPVHILIVPRKPIPRISEASEEDQAILGRLLIVAKKLAEKLNLKNGFRLVINDGTDAGQEVFHLHLHLLAGRKMGWPPG